MIASAPTPQDSANVNATSVATSARGNAALVMGADLSPLKLRPLKMQRKSATGARGLLWMV